MKWIVVVVAWNLISQGVLIYVFQALLEIDGRNQAMITMTDRHGYE